MSLLATLAQVRSEVAAAEGDDSGDGYVKRALAEMSARLERMTEKEYAPRKITRRLDALGFHIDEWHDELHLDWPLLEVVTLKDGEGKTLAAYNHMDKTGDYLLLGDDTPYWSIARVNGGWSSYSGTWRQAIELTGFFGYRRRYSEAWVNSGDTVRDNPLSAGATLLTVTNAWEDDGETARFSAGNLLKIESEFVEVLDAEPQILTVRRGVNGTTAASHAQGIPIFTWIPEPPITRAALRWCAYVYSRRGKFDQLTVDAIAAVKYPEDLPGEVYGIVSGYLPMGWTAV